MFEMLPPEVIITAALMVAPGPEMLAALATVDPATLTIHEKVDLLVAIDRQQAAVAALRQQALAAVGAGVQEQVLSHERGAFAADVALRAAHSEIAAAARISDRAATNEYYVAQVLTTELPDVQYALAIGVISIWHAKAIVEVTSPLSPDNARLVAERVLTRAAHQTVGQLRRSLRRAVLAVEPDAAADRAKQAHADRTVDWWPREDGMAELRLITSATDVMTLFSVIDSIAQKAKADGAKPGEPGWIPIDARRADAFVALITQGATTTQPPAVNVTIDLATLLGLQQNPAELAGYGPIPAPLARTLAADGRWRRMILDPRTGELLDLGRDAYKPSAALARFVKTRDRTCTFPSCGRAADHSDLDHGRPYRPNDPDSGRTDRANLHPPCKNHHVLKHHGRWRFRTDKKTGAHSWTSPSGHVYPVEPIDHRPEPAAPAEAPDLQPCPF